MELDQIRAFLATIDQGSLSAAARVLRRTQPGVTRLIQALEVEVGAPLLDRSTKPARPTPRGLAMAESARKVLEAVGELESVARPRRRSCSIPLRIGVSHALVRLLGEPAFGRWMRSRPQLELRVESGWSLGLIGRLREQRLDAVLGPFAIDWRPPEGLRGVRCGEDELVLIAPAGTRLPAAPALDKLMDHRWVLNPDGCGVRAWVQRVFAAHGRQLIPTVEVTGDFGALLEFVSAGLGVTLVPRWLVRTDPLAGGIQMRSLSGETMRVSLWLCLRPLPAALEPMTAGLEKAVLQTLDEWLVVPAPSLGH